MKLVAIATSVFALGILATGSARADTLFEVAHARANYRSGSVSEFDRELLDRWGRPSGYYPASRIADTPHRRVLLKKRDRRARHW
jgi:hypothetical protein